MCCMQFNFIQVIHSFEANRRLMACMFSSKHKYNSGTGWPSFYQAAIADNVATNIDRKYGLTRTEVHCAKVCLHLFEFHLRSINLS